MEYTIDYCKNNKVAVHCLNKDEIINVAKIIGFADYKKQHILQSVYYVGKICFRYSSKLYTWVWEEYDYYKAQQYAIIPASTFIQDNTPRLYTEAEVLEREQKAFEAAREGEMRGIDSYTPSWKNKYKSFDDYKQTLNLK